MKPSVPHPLADAAFCAGLPKAELHLHIEGTLSAAQKQHLARRNRHPMGDLDIAEIERSHDFGGSGDPAQDLRQMLDCYYAGIEVLSARADFFDIGLAHLEACHREGLVYTEISFDPQAHTARGLPLADVVEGLHDALRYGQARWGLHAQLILCINRDRSVASAFATLDEAAPYRERGWIVGLGLDSNEEGNPPSKFTEVFRQARSQGYRLTAHCDVDQRHAVRHLWQCVELLEVERIDHGLNCLEDPRLMDTLREQAICLTACPTWRPRDPRPRRVDRVRAMLDQGLRVTINSDDPGVLASGTLGQMLPAVAREGRFTRDEIATLLRNAFLGAWIEPQARQAYVQALERQAAQGCPP